ncbi:MAG: hypothetical protein LBF43_03360 [Puniceicoccales bacterium]|jgi:hypothetical protein|nr:hypothetical protein [Puniceicoccales bacterium]
MKTKLLLISILMVGSHNAFCNFFGFERMDERYALEDMRIQTGTYPFPLIFHYRQGGDDSKKSEFRIKDTSLTFDNLPSNIQGILQSRNIPVADIQIFEAFAKLEEVDCNYFTHAWAMDIMIENRLAVVESGIFEAFNLQAVNGEIGINGLVPQTMSFHDKIYLSGNSARFHVNDVNQLVGGWFVSVYDPTHATNQANGNTEGQRLRAIVVKWTLIPSSWITAPQNCTAPELLPSPILTWKSGYVDETL